MGVPARIDIDSGWGERVEVWRRRFAWAGLRFDCGYLLLYPRRESLDKDQNKID